MYNLSSLGYTFLWVSIFLLSSFSSVNAFQDTLDWAHEEWLTIYSQVDDFRPQDSITRWEIAKFFATYGSLIGIEEQAHRSCDFQDIGNYDYTLVPSIIQVCKLWLMQGHNNNYYPTNQLLWAEALTVVIRSLHGFQDETMIPWRSQYATIARERGLITLWQESSLEQAVTRQVVLVWLHQAYQQFAQDNLNDAQDTHNYIAVPVVRVVDGDTIIVHLHGQDERVRLIWIDAPESVHPTRPVEPFGEEASQFMKDLLENQSVLLEMDVQERDMYGRLLAYVRLNEVMVNNLLLEKWLAQVSTRPPNVKYVDLFTATQSASIEASNGMRNKDDILNTVRVNINTASIDELKNIIHIDDDRAQQIITLRPFHNVESLTRVSWIGNARVQDIIDEWIAFVE